MASRNLRPQIDVEKNPDSIVAGHSTESRRCGHNARMSTPDAIISRHERRRVLDRRLLSGALWTGIIVTVLVVLQAAKDFFVPLVIAIIAVYLVTVLSRLAQRIKIAGRNPPTALTMIFSFAVIFGLGYALFAIVVDNAYQVASVAPDYKARFISLQKQFFSRVGIEEPDAMRQIMTGLDIQSLFTTVASTLAGVLGRVSLVVLYSIFILLELRFVRSKLHALFPNPERRHAVQGILERIDRDIHTYLGVKTLVSLITATLSYIIMRMVGLDFAEFWALLIFILNYIPTIGSMVATILPTLLALVQFPDTLAPFLIVGIGITAVQQLMGSILEPNWMGHILNLSPLVVFVSLILWGYIWGIVGMFLCVPITVILVIVLANFESTRWVSILLSKSGQFQKT